MTVAELAKEPHFVVIIRCLHTRGQDQQDALAELAARGLWLSSDQKITAGLYHG